MERKQIVEKCARLGLAVGSPILSERLHMAYVQAFGRAWRKLAQLERHDTVQDVQFEIYQKTLGRWSR